MVLTPGSGFASVATSVCNPVCPCRSQPVTPPLAIAPFPRGPGLQSVPAAGTSSRGLHCPVIMGGSVLAVPALPTCVVYQAPVCCLPPSGRPFHGKQAPERRDTATTDTYWSPSDSPVIRGPPCDALCPPVWGQRVRLTSTWQQTPSLPWLRGHLPIRCHEPASHLIFSPPLAPMLLSGQPNPSPPVPEISAWCADTFGHRAASAWEA